MSNTINEEKLNAAREKLACHIEPPKKSSCGDTVAESGGRIRLTEMTTAGG